MCGKDPILTTCANTIAEWPTIAYLGTEVFAVPGASLAGIGDGSRDYRSNAPEPLVVFPWRVWRSLLQRN
jgi:hypothetical protein